MDGRGCGVFGPFAAPWAGLDPGRSFSHLSNLIVTRGAKRRPRLRIHWIDRAVACASRDPGEVHPMKPFTIFGFR
jgi:hypothetical protein